MPLLSSILLVKEQENLQDGIVLLSPVHQQNYVFSYFLRNGHHNVFSNLRRRSPRENMKK